MQQSAVALLVALLNGGYQAELGGQLWEALLLSGPGEAVVHIRPLVVFTLGGVEQILGCVAHTIELLKPHSGVSFLVLCSLLEQGGDLLIALVLSH